MEVLAPAGGSEQLLAAVRCGADAVYLGAKGFNARRNAENFDEDTLPQTVAFCHARGVRVHVTLTRSSRTRKWTRWTRRSAPLRAAAPTR